MVRSLTADDVVFMYFLDDDSEYEAYAATVQAWGGAEKPENVARLRRLGVHPTGSMWCLTAGAHRLHRDPVLREAVCRDIQGEPLAVPWLEDGVHEGTPCWFGCFRHPAFRAHMCCSVAKAMRGGADGLHVDDPLGTAHPAIEYGGCFCDACMSGFTAHLRQLDDPQHRHDAGVQSFAGFDYRQLVRRHTSTAEAVQVQADRIPLMDVYRQWQVAGAVENLRQLHRLAADVVQRPVLLSANTPLQFTEAFALTAVCDYLIAEVPHHASTGRSGLLDAIATYRTAEALGKPLAGTACGEDWSHIKNTGHTAQARLWVALGYASGQRFMAPAKQWCHTPGVGTHWYRGDREAYAPLTRFVRQQTHWLCGFRTAGPLVVPDYSQADLLDPNQRRALADAVQRTRITPVTSADGGVWALPRVHEDGQRAAVHLLHVEGHADGHPAKPARNVQVVLPADMPRHFTDAEIHHCEGGTEPATLRHTAAGQVLEVPHVDLWSIVGLTTARVNGQGS